MEPTTADFRFYHSGVNYDYVTTFKEVLHVAFPDESVSPSATGSSAAGSSAPSPLSASTNESFSGISSLASLSFESRTPSPLSASTNDSFSSDDECKAQSFTVPDEAGFITPPSSPSSQREKPKVTPEKMKNHCLITSPPLPQPRVGSPLSRRVYNLWIAAHQEEVQDSLEEVVSSLKYYSQEDFITQLGESVTWMNSQLAELYGADHNPREHCIVLAQEGKSNLWVAELAKQHFEFDAERYLDLGLNNADQFTSMLDEVSESLEIVREKFCDKTIVLFDDASYSGKQMSSHLLEVTQAVKDYKLKVRQVIVVVPFSTPFSQKVISESTARVKKACPAAICPAVTLPMISDLSGDTHRLIANLWYKGSIDNANKIGLAFFQHKVPNDQSFPAALAKGSVYFLTDGKSTAQKDSFPFLKEIRPAYKGRKALRFLQGQR